MPKFYDFTFQKLNILYFIFIALFFSQTCFAGHTDVNFMDQYKPVNFEYDDSLKVEPINTKSALPEKWYEDAVFYEVFVREFYDSNNDGVGDLRGIIEKLDYIKDLGIGGLWFMPINDSYDDDHGYAVTDYMGIDAEYGTLKDFDELVTEAHKRGIGIVLDQVYNHCSDFHPFFMEANKDKNSEYRKWFLWHEKEDPLWQHPWLSFSPWHEGLNDNFYYGIFSSWMPDFNYRHKPVYDYMKEVMQFWLEKGVDGFRIDAASHITESGSGSIDSMSNQPETFKVFEGLRKVLDKYENRFWIGEANATNLDFLGDGTDLFHSFFNFSFVYDMTKSFYRKDNKAFIDSMKSLSNVPRGAYYSNVLGNHDTFLGRRVMSRFRKKKNIVKAASVILLTTPGIPFIYYGEEIGMTNSTRYRHDSGLRTPMQWDNSKHSGFSKAKRVQPRKTNKNYKKVNVAKQIDNPDSLLNHYKSLIKIRNEHKALRTGKMEFIDIDKSIVSFIRENADEKLLIITSINSKKIKTKFLIQNKDVKIDILFNSTGKEAYDTKNGLLTLSPYQSLILKLK